MQKRLQGIVPVELANAELLALKASCAAPCTHELS